MGYFLNTSDMDPGPAVVNINSSAGQDIFISKFDAAGNFLWVKQIGNDFTVSARALNIDNNGNLYLTGDFYSTLDLDPGPGVFNLTYSINGSTEVFLLKLDPAGNFAWAKKLTDADYASFGRTVVVASSGNVYACGNFRGVGDFDPGPAVFTMTSAASGYDLFISKFDNSGNFIWAKQLGGLSCISMELDALENIYMTGSFSGTIDFNPGAAVYNLTANNSNGPGWSDAYVAKFDMNGNFIFAKQVSGSANDVSWDIALNLAGEILLTGEFSEISDFDPGAGTYNLSSPFNSNAFVLKLDNAGNFIWAKQFATDASFSSSSRGFSVAVDPQGNVYTMGDFQGIVDFDPATSSYIIPSISIADIYISKLTSTGAFVFAVPLAGNNYTQGASMNIDQQRNIIVTGDWGGITDFDPTSGVFNLTSLNITPANSPPDAFLLKLSQSCIQTSTSTINAVACNSYTINGQTYTGSSTYTQALINTAGCDSIITINLTINGSNTTSSAAACDSYSWQGQTYITSGTYHANYIDVNGCDSILNFILTINHSVSTNIIASICEGQSYAGHTTTGTYTDTYLAANGCDSTRTLNLVVKSKSFSTLDTVICEGQSYAGHTTTGTYSDTYVAVNGCDSIRTLNLIVKPKSFITLDIVICEGQSYAGHTNNGTYTDTYVAANGCDSIRTLHLVISPRKYTPVNAAICEGQTYLAGGQQQTSAGVYNDTLHSSLGCDSIIITTLIVNSNPKPELGQDKDLCTGTVITFNPGSFITYQWQDMSTLTTFTADSTGLYWVTVKDNNNCVATDSVRINTILPLPANFLKNLNDSICPNQNLVLRPMNNYTSYNWSTGEIRPNITIQLPGQYWLNVKDTHGCVGSDTVQVFSKNCFTGVFIPSAFTPNGDGNNDLFKASVLGNLVSYNLDIYDRSGQLIFRTKNYQLGWDGTFRGKPYATATFVWYCYYQLEGKLPELQSGTVTLLR